MIPDSADAEPVKADLQQLIQRSGELTAQIISAWQSVERPNDPSSHAAEGLCSLAIEHAVATQSLLGAFPASAIALIRPQFESLVRAVWAKHAASPSDLDRLIAPLSAQSQQAAKKLPAVPEMLARLEERGPRGAAALLAKARSRLGDGLNSFVHGGIHPFARNRDGYPISLLIDMQKNSNALSFLTLIVLVEITLDPDVSAFMATLHQEFDDVLPALEPFDVPAA
ncbi:MAG: hypothetical protein DI562_03650 [Stenotrophomonas acidaminiphila]|jgi:hypothetical protein|uniref:DUF6988 family protein n=1 Tax=Pseudoxanthomonas TaxID=83618 RepID=UPI000DB71E29|nr:hypothetical protein [Pseudoxanthomonas mexicana]PZQ32358.1 MAG: hypothetical protein DI562_03650 [Stenotrophomonas acidaminiphila]WBX93122.1 hypothetical protein PE064_15750 [Pseudoxanthomonas mexicana]